RRSDLFYAARQIHSQAIVFTLDADEILSAEILNPKTRSEIIHQLGLPGSSLLLPWIMLWKSPLEYRTEPYGIWSQRWMRCIYWDDGKSEVPYEGFLHFPRVPRAFHQGEVLFQLPLLHYQFSAWKRTSIKQAHWRILEWEKGPQTLLNSLRINLLYAIARDTWDAKTTSIPLRWLQNYQDHGVDLTSPIDEPYPWHLQEILSLLLKNGSKRYALLDIWDLPWSAYHKKLIPREEKELQDPRPSWIKIYHDLIYGISYLGSSVARRIYQFIRS
ncbi:MAG: hypothetical protein V4507_08635, partial [Verrucomicrobiota bacterium]